jgi:hypothetical protein
MDSDFDPQREAEAVMKLAAAAEGAERQSCSAWPSAG